MSMNISGDSQSIINLASAQSASKMQVEKDVALLKKANDLVKDQGMAMIEMIEESSVSPQVGLDTYA